MNVLRLYKRFTETTVYQSFLLALTQSFVAIFFLAIDFFYSKNLSVENFGSWKRVIFIVNLTIPILSLGIAEGYKYYLAKEGKGKWMFANTFAFYFLIALAFFIVTIFVNVAAFIGWIDIKEYYLLSFLFPLAYFVFVLNKMLRYAYINDSKVKLHSNISIIGFAFTALTLIGCYLYFNQFKIYYLYIGVCLYILLFAFPLYSLIKKGKYIITFKWLNREYFFNVLKQGFPLYLATFVGALIINTDTLIINTFEDTKTFAIFSVGAMEIPIFAMLSAAFSQRIYPNLVKLVSSGQKKEAKDLWIKTTLQVSYITYPLLILLMFFAKDIIYLIYSAEYEKSVFLFKTYLLLGIFRNNYYGALITASGNAKYIFRYAVLLLVLNAFLSFFLYYLIGISGVVFGTVISTVCINLIQLNHEGILKDFFHKFLFNYKILVLIIIILLVYGFDIYNI